ncbi:MAG: flagellar M-ring protein FliF C-terminal domain-containing protein [Candidatus Velthaea sp.]
MLNGTVPRRWQDLSRSAQIGSLALVAIVLIGLAAFFFTRDTQTGLFARPLLPEQLADVETRLAAWNVPFSATSDNVRVLSAQKNETLLRLSLAGVPRLHIADSSETLAKVGALTPQSVLEAQTRDGLAGDLALGLRDITGISDARVIIAPATPGYFADETAHEASASVQLVRAPSAQLSPETIGGIKAFVAAGVPGLDPAHVAVVDDRGVALSGTAWTGEGEAQQLQASIQSALDQALGNGRAIVRAHVDVDPTTSTQHETKRTPVTAKPIAGQTTDEHYTSDKKRYSKIQSSTDRGSDVVVTDKSSAAGRPQRVSIAVFLDRPLASEIPLIRSLVESAGGLNYARGDSLSVQPIALATAPQTAPIRTVPPAQAVLATFVPLLPPTIWILALGGLLVVFARPLKRLLADLGPGVPAAAPTLAAMSVPGPASAATLPPVSPDAIFRALADEPPHTAATVIAGLSTPDAAAVLDLYPADARREIISRLARPRTPLANDVSGAVGHG